MQNKLLSIFQAITPDNIKDIKVISDSMEIFIELLSENSQISSDIRIALSEQTTDSIAEELPKIYLYDYYSMIENLKNNKTIVKKFRDWNATLNPDLYPQGLPYIGEKLVINYFIIGEEGAVLVPPSDTDNDFNFNPLSVKLDTLRTNMLQNKAENYYVNRLFKQSKGLTKSINFLYDILNEHLVSAEERFPLIIEETGIPFVLNISGSVDKDIYAASVEYLAHPLGFVYNYNYISELRLDDDYSLKKYYDIRTLEVRCLSGNVEAYNKEVVYILDKPNYLKIIFSDNFYLLQENDVVKYFDNTGVLVKSYPSNNHYSIFLDYDIVYVSSLTDNVKFLSEEIFSIDEIQMSDEISYSESKEFDFGFLIGTDIVGTNKIRKDSDQFETVILKDTGIINSESSVSELYGVIGTDEYLISENGTSDDTFNVASIDEEFSITTF